MKYITIRNRISKSIQTLSEGIIFFFIYYYDFYILFLYFLSIFFSFGTLFFLKILYFEKGKRLAW